MFSNVFMLSLIGGFVDTMKELLYISLALVVVILVGIGLVKSSAFRKFCLGLLCFIIMLGGVISGVNLNKYYNTSGGIIGKLSQVFNPNAVEIDNREEIEFNFKSIMLEQIEGDKYRAEFVTDNFIELAPNEAYAVFVNDAPCELIEYGEDFTSDSISSDYVISEFYYAFYDEQLEFVLKDKLTFRFAFYKKSTKLIVETIGGRDAVALWNSYFQKNDFIVKIKPMESVYMSSYCSVRLMIDDSCVSAIKVKKNSVYTLPETLEKPNYNFIGYSLDKVNVLNETSVVVSDNLVIYTLWQPKMFDMTVSLDGGEMLLNEQIYSEDFVISNSFTDVIKLSAPTKEFYEFDYWRVNLVLDGKTFGLMVDDSDFNVSIEQIVKDYNDSIIVWEEETIYIEEISSISIIANYIATTNNPSNLSDYDIQKYLIDNYYGSSMEVCSTNEEFIRDIYLSVTYDRELYDNGSLFEIMTRIVAFGSDVYDIEVTEQTTAREFLESHYINVWKTKN